MSRSSPPSLLQAAVQGERAIMTGIICEADLGMLSHLSWCYSQNCFSAKVKQEVSDCLLGPFMG